GILDNKLAIKNNNIIFFTATLNGEYPDYKKIIPIKEQLKINVKLPVVQTLNIMKQMAILTENNPLKKILSVVNLHFEKGLCLVSAETTGIGYGRSTFNIDYNGTNINFSCNPYFIKDILQEVNEDYIMIGLPESLKPIVIYSEIDKSYLYIVMPMKTI
ncbi:MAG: DNA polymerase III subunit beta, partial [Endomicrobium sp.]|nr:DNA polymerase III subunit beta [Endomicrobium sp.]